MGLFIYKINNDKNIEIEKSIDLQIQVNNLADTISNLQEKIDTISNIVNSNINVNENMNSNTYINENINSNNTNIKFSDTEIKAAIQMCLNLESARESGPITIVETLGLVKNYSDYYYLEKKATKNGFIKTNIKFSEFKDAILKYMTEECYQNNWYKDVFDNEDGYLCYNNGGATGVSYIVNSIKKSKNGYIANVTGSSEGPDWDFTVNFTIDKTKCIITSYEFNT